MIRTLLLAFIPLFVAVDVVAVVLIPGCHSASPVPIPVSCPSAYR